MVWYYYPRTSGWNLVDRNDSSLRRHPIRNGWVFLYADFYILINQNEGGEVANNENLKRLTPSEAREYGKMGGKASGEARRKRADFRKTLNTLLTVRIENNMTPALEALGLESTLESAMLMAQINEAMKGNTKAAYFVAQYAGQSGLSDEDIRNKEADTELKHARKQAVTGENETDEAIDKLDQILKEMRDNAFKQEAE